MLLFMRCDARRARARSRSPFEIEKRFIIEIRELCSHERCKMLLNQMHFRLFLRRLLMSSGFFFDCKVVFCFFKFSPELFVLFNLSSS